MLSRNLVKGIVEGVADAIAAIYISIVLFAIEVVVLFIGISLKSNVLFGALAVVALVAIVLWRPQVYIWITYPAILIVQLTRR